MDDDKLQRALPPVDVRIVAMGELRLYLVSEDELSAIERGSPAATMVTLANSLLSVAGGSLVSLLLGGPPPSPYNFTIATVLIAVCFVVGLVLLIISRRFQRDPSDVIERIRSRAAVPMAPPIVAQSEVLDVSDEEESR